jgi:WD40 repeat protein
MLPLRRLEVLLEQAKAEQRRNCPFHAHDVHISLLKDCKCDPGQFPSYTTRILKEHTDEIWRLEFSHDGKWLATAGRDKTVIIWNVMVSDDRSPLTYATLTVSRAEQSGFSLERILRDHSDFISCLAWSPDDSVLLTVAESVIKMWNTEVGGESGREGTRTSKSLTDPCYRTDWYMHCHFG